jgi:hypothetical protein
MSRWHFRAASSFSARAAYRFVEFSIGPRVVGFSMFFAALAFLIGHRTACSRGRREFGVREIKRHGSNRAADCRGRPCSSARMVGSWISLRMCDSVRITRLRIR